MSVDGRTISTYFTRMGWSHRTLSHSHVVASFRCDVPFYYYPVALEVTSSEHWVITRALLQQHVGRAHADAVVKYLMALNKGIYRARFLLVESCVVLQSEISAQQCSFAAFQEGLVAICQYCQLMGVEIAALSTNPSIAELFARLTHSAPGDLPVGVAQQIADDFELELSTNAFPTLASERDRMIASP